MFSQERENQAVVTKAMAALMEVLDPVLTRIL
jgi:hypothetical protein